MKYLIEHKNCYIVKIIENSFNNRNGKKSNHAEMIKYLEENGVLDKNIRIGERLQSSYYRTKRTLKDIIFNNCIAGISYFVTLTYREPQPTSHEEAYNHLRAYLNNLSKQKLLFKYIAVLEKGTKNTKRYHWHLIVLDGIKEDYRNEWNHPKSHIIDKWPHGNNDLKLVTDNDAGKLANYLSKYLTKSDYLYHKQVYKCSNNLYRSKISYDFDKIYQIEKQNKQLDFNTYHSEYLGTVYETQYSLE